MKSIYLFAAVTPFVVAASACLGNDPTSWQEGLGISIVAGNLRISATYVRDTSAKLRVSVFELAPCYAFHARTGCRTDEVWKLRRAGLGWGEIAHRLGVHPGTFNKLRKQGLFDNDRFWRDAVCSRYKVPDSDVNDLRKRGYSWMEIAPMAHVCHTSGVDLRDVESRYHNDRNWDHVREHFRGGRKEGIGKPGRMGNEHGHSEKQDKGQGWHGDENPGDRGHGHGRGRKD
jgi:hypothetical protein